MLKKLKRILKKKQNETKTEAKPKEVETQTQTHIPDEIKEFMESWKAEQKQKAIAAKKQQILEAAKTKFNENQIPILKTVVEKFNFDFEQTDDVLLQTVITETTDFIKNNIGDITPQNQTILKLTQTKKKIKKIQEIAKNTTNIINLKLTKMTYRINFSKQGLMEALCKCSIVLHTIVC